MATCNGLLNLDDLYNTELKDKDLPSDKIDELVNLVIKTCAFDNSAMTQGMFYKLIAQQRNIKDKTLEKITDDLFSSGMLYSSADILARMSKEAYRKAFDKYANKYGYWQGFIKAFDKNPFIASEDMIEKLWKYVNSSNLTQREKETYHHTLLKNPNCPEKIINRQLRTDKKIRTLMKNPSLFKYPKLVKYFKEWPTVLLQRHYTGINVAINVNNKDIPYEKIVDTFNLEKYVEIFDRLRTPEKDVLLRFYISRVDEIPITERMYLVDKLKTNELFTEEEREFLLG